MTATLTPAQRAAAWERDDPDELGRVASEYEALGFTAYAEHLRAWAGGDRSNWLPRPW